ncbi:MAG TPA: hypothetical protein VF163_09565 [Micromonosporaceae bacterium]
MIKRSVRWFLVGVAVAAAAFVVGAVIEAVKGRTDDLATLPEVEQPVDGQPQPAA